MTNTARLLTAWNTPSIPALLRLVIAEKSCVIFVHLISSQCLSSAELNESLGFIVSVALTSALMDTLIFTLILAVMFMLFSLTLFIYPVRIRRQFQQIMDESGESFFDDAIYPVIDEKVR